MYGVEAAGAGGAEIAPAGWARYVAAYAGLAVLTGAVAAALVPVNIKIGQDLSADPQNDAQIVASWRLSAGLACTSATAPGQLAALVAGIPARRWARARKMNGAAVAFLAGAGLGLAVLVPAFAAASPRLGDLARAPQMRTEEGAQVVDPALIHHGGVLLAMAVTLILFAVASGIGYAVTTRGPVPAGVLAVPPFVAYALFIRSGEVFAAFHVMNTWFSAA